jgi:hypothetical protein
MHLRKKFKRQTVKCPYPGCDKLVVNGGGLTQHIQASHAAAQRHPLQSPMPGPADHEVTPGPFNDDMGGPGHEGVGPQRRGASTIIHPIIDG